MTDDEADRFLAENPGVQGLAQLGRNAIERVRELEAELARERETNAVLRRDLADPPPDIQELALKRCGHFEIVAKLIAERDALRAEAARLREALDRLLCATEGFAVDIVAKQKARVALREEP